MKEKNNNSAFNEKTLSEANKCIAIGAGVGGLGAVGALTLAGTCPLCIVIAPALIGVGLYKRIKEKRKLLKTS